MAAAAQGAHRNLLPASYSPELNLNVDLKHAIGSTVPVNQGQAQSRDRKPHEQTRSLP